MAKKFYLVSSYVKNELKDLQFPVFNDDKLEEIKGEGLLIKKAFTKTDHDYVCKLLKLELDKELKEKIRGFLEDCLERENEYSTDKNSVHLFHIRIFLRDLVKDYNTLKEWEEYKINRRIFFNKLKKFYGYSVIGFMIGFFVVKIAQKILELNT